MDEAVRLLEKAMDLPYVGGGVVDDWKIQVWDFWKTEVRSFLRDEFDKDILGVTDE